MAFNQVNALEFNQIKAQIKEYLRSQSQFSDYDFEGSSLSVLIDTLAYNTYYTSVNANLAVNEGFLETACLLYTSPSPRDNRVSRMPSSA